MTILGLNLGDAVVIVVTTVVLLLMISSWLHGKLTVEVPEGHAGVVVQGKNDNPVLAEAGQPGVQPKLLYAGRYSRFKHWNLRVFPLVAIPTGALGFVTSHCGPENNDQTVPYRLEFGDFTDIDAYLRAGGCKGPQAAVLPAGTYAINPYAFTVTVFDDTEDPYRTYGAFGSDHLPEARMYSIESYKAGTAVAFRAPKGYEDSFVRLFLGDTEPTMQLVRVVTAPSPRVTIEWEFCRPISSDGVNEMTTLDQLTKQYFEGWSGKGIADFIDQLDRLKEALDDQSGGIRPTAAFMLPTVAV
ncbi:MAG TPA: hypothetical protein VFT87_05480 [Candidatus Saccharimonadales bacterium]|nr:hypothetical protein [Candidatus Saccharimonadales bacterium]